MNVLEKFSKEYFPNSTNTTQLIVKKNYKSTLVKIEGVSCPTVMAKIYENNGYLKGKIECELLRELNKIKFNCPQLLTQFDDTESKKYYLFMSYIHGMTLADIYCQNNRINIQVLQEYCNQILLLHKVHINNNLCKLLQKKDYFRERLAICEKHKHLFFNQGFNVDLLFKQIEQQVWPSKASVLIHGDYHFDNVIKTRNSGLYVIDYEECFYSDFFVELARIVATKDIYTSKILLALFQRITKFDEQYFYPFLLLELMYNIVDYYHFFNSGIVKKSAVERYRQYIFNLKHYYKMVH